METTQTITDGLTFEKVWVVIQENARAIRETDRNLKETDRRLKETIEETDRRLKEALEKTDKQMKKTFEETDRQMKETIEETDRRLKEALEKTDKQLKKTFEETDKQMKETDRQMKETGKRMGEISNRFGEIVEYMIVPNLVEKFRELDFEFTKAGPNVEIADEVHDIFVEIDAFLENGDKAMIVEIKAKPSLRDIDDHVKRMEKLRRYADMRGDKRKYLGAIGGVVFNKHANDYTLKNGFYVIEPSGETLKITSPEGKYSPREW
jgi:hypothetical protein